MIAERIEGELQGDADRIVTGVSSIEEAEEGDITFAEGDRFYAAASRSPASVVVAPVGASVEGKTVIHVARPRESFRDILNLFAMPLNLPAGIHPSAVVAPDARIGEGVHIGPHVAVGAGAVIGRGCRLMAGAVVGDGCILGEDCLLHPNVTLYDRVILDSRVILHSGAVIGADGFGYMQIDGQNRKIPQIGTVHLCDDVEIGANSTVDRAKTGETVIGARTKVDNLAHIAHNCKVGEDCIVVAQVGVAGSCRIGDRVILAGQAGLKDHLSIGDGAVVMAQAGVFGDVPSGAMVSGYPARPHRERLRQDAAAAGLPEYVKRLRALEKEIAALKAEHGSPAE